MQKYWLMDSEFTSTFKEYVLPMQLHRFRQGLGRLIRNENDRGIIVSFDDRLINSNYKTFEQTLENYRQKKATFNSLKIIKHKFKKKSEYKVKFL